MSRLLTSPGFLEPLQLAGREVPGIPSGSGVVHAISVGRHSPPFQVVNIGGEGLPKAGE